MFDTENINVIKDRRDSNLRWVILLLCCFSTFGDYYCIDNVGVLHDSLKDQFKELGDSFEYYFSLLYSLYSTPNIVLPLIGGILVMRFGCRTMYLIFGLSIVLGQLTFTIGSENHSMNLMLLGRIVFGFGGESINICQCSMIIKWFYKSQVALPLGLTITVARLGSVLNDVLSPRLSYVDNATPALWTGFFICILSFLTSILLCIVDWNKDINMGRGERENEENQASFGSLKEFSRLYWIITILCTCLYGAVMPFNYIASGFFTSTFLSHMNKVDAQNTAGLYMSIPFFVSAFLVPLYGFMIDRYGKRAYLSFVAAVTSLISFVVFYFFPPIFGLVLLGCTYSMFASVIWPAISLVVKPSLVGFAYGITTSAQNAGLAVFPLIVASIFSATKSYYATMLYFVGISLVSILLALYLIYENKLNDNIINKTTFIEHENEDQKVQLNNLKKKGEYNTFV